MDFEIEIQWKTFPLHPETPIEGVTLEELFADRNIDIPAMLARLKSVADELGLPFGERKKSFNSRLAQELGKWAETKGRGNEFHDAVFRAYFADGKNIARFDILLKLAEDAGLPGKEAGQILQNRTFRGAVDSDWALCERLGISAVPTFLIDHQSLVGAQSYEALQQLLLDNGVKRR